MYWIIYLSIAITPKILYDSVKLIFPESSDKDIRNKVYCLELAKWIQRYSYSDKDYFFTLFDSEPFFYSYKYGVDETSTVRRKLAVQAGLKKVESIPRFVLRLAATARIPAP